MTAPSVNEALRHAFAGPWPSLPGGLVPGTRPMTALRIALYAAGRACYLCPMTDYAPAGSAGHPADYADKAYGGSAVHASFGNEFAPGRWEAEPGGAPDRIAPVADSMCYSSTGFAMAHDFTMDLLEALQEQGLQVESYYPELGHGQQ